MNFPPLVKAWIQLIAFVLMTGGGVTIAARAGGAGWGYAIFCGAVTAAGNVYHALAPSLKDKAATQAPFPPS